MNDWPSLEEILIMPEGEYIERTQSITKPEGSKKDRFQEKLGKTLCAFANDINNHGRPGYFLIGISDDGKISGYNYKDEDGQKIDNYFLSGLVSPTIFPERKIYSTDKGDLLAIKVNSSSLAPHRSFKKIWIRLGSSVKEANPAEENRLIEAGRLRFGQSQDASPCINASLDGIDSMSFQAYRFQVMSEETIAANQRPLEQQLAVLNLYNLDYSCPTVAGLICFGTDQLSSYRVGLPGGSGVIQLVRYEGDELTDRVIFKDEICSGIYSTRERVNAWLAANNAMRRMDIVGNDTKLSKPYPETALRELVFNAIAHRDYSLAAAIQIRWFNSRVEIISPGSICPPNSKENFIGYSSRRNPVISDVMEQMNMMERQGMGLIKVNSSLKNHGNPPAKFEFPGSGAIFQVTVFTNLSQG